MKNKRCLLISVAATLVAGAVALYSCDNKDSINYAEEGKKAAQEMCSCLTSNAANPEAQVVCVLTTESKYATYLDNKGYKEAFNQEIEKCSQSKYRAYLGAKAGMDLCACLTAAGDNYELQTACVLGPMATLDEEIMYDLDFGATFTVGWYGCYEHVPNWVRCMFGGEDCEFTDEQLLELAAEATEELCQFFSSTPEAADKETGLGLLMSSTKYDKYFYSPVFVEALLGGMTVGCPSVVPQWFWDMFIGGE
jgi:hypothetical protein